ncbi:MAG TPA: helix-turn-helix domain-containing protein [Thermoanaerobaculia bacterium]
MELGLRMQVLIKQQNLSQKELAHSMGLKQSKLSRMLGGRQDLPYFVVKHIAEKLRMPVCELAGEPPHAFSRRAKEAIRTLVEEARIEEPPLRWLEIRGEEGETRRIDVTPLVRRPGEIRDSPIPLVLEVDVPAIYAHAHFVLQVNRDWWTAAGIFEGDLLLMRGVENVRNEHKHAIVFRRNGVEDIRWVERFSVDGVRLHDFAGVQEPVLFDPKDIEIIGVIIGRLGGPPRASR